MDQIYEMKNILSLWSAIICLIIVPGVRSQTITPPVITITSTSTTYITPTAKSTPTTTSSNSSNSDGTTINIAIVIAAVMVGAVSAAGIILLIRKYIKKNKGRRGSFDDFNIQVKNGDNDLAHDADFGISGSEIYEISNSQPGLNSKGTGSGNYGISNSQPGLNAKGTGSGNYGISNSQQVSSFTGTGTDYYGISHSQQGVNYGFPSHQGSNPMTPSTGYYRIPGNGQGLNVPGTEVGHYGVPNYHQGSNVMATGDGHYGITGHHQTMGSGNGWNNGMPSHQSHGSHAPINVVPNAFPNPSSRPVNYDASYQFNNSYN
ncbi:7127_t:CDS:2 [Acaulospora morrowiae]|uniref:7127_t:CDS:1 n=1 Tax=Acaulospora morrowiae TaxID=94023 RepID=A0A9N9ENK1_9GLOM|nr:7127_t:CDS:2 [Acaulospora morrowiae]